MRTDLRDQIRIYANALDTSQTPVSSTEARELAEEMPRVASGQGPATGLRLSPRGPWPAVAAAVVVLVVFGLFAWVLPAQEPTPPANTTTPREIPGFPESAFFTTSEIPDGFALRTVQTLGGSRVVYLADSGDVWLPSDGGFAIDDVSRFIASVEGGPDLEALAATYAPGSDFITVGGRPAVILETMFDQAGVSEPLIWVVGGAGDGAYFEISALGMTRQEVLAVAGGVTGVTIQEVADLGRELEWDVKVSTFSDDFTVDPPSPIEQLADRIQVAFGVDLLWPRLSAAGGGVTVITTDSGEIVDTDGDPIRSYTADLFLEVPDDRLEEMLLAFPGVAELSPAQRDVRIDRYLDDVGGAVLSEDPYVIQALPGPEPQFDTDALGRELPLAPVSTASVVPGYILGRSDVDSAAASQDRPVVVVGSVEQPESDATTPVTALVWFTLGDAVCEGSASGDGMTSGCGSEILAYLGITGSSTGDGSNDVSYAVPLDTSVVQIVTASGDYWQRPRGGHGLIPYGDTVDRPTMIIAYDAEGNEIGRWENPY